MNFEQNHNERLSNAESVRTEEFVRLFSEHQRELYRFVFLLIPNRSLAEDVLQETSVILWRKFHEFQKGTDFFRWAAQIARNKARDFRKSAARDRHRYWSEDLIESIANTRLDNDEELLQQRALLAECVRLLTPADRNLVRRCFADRVTIKSVAEHLGRPVNTLYKAMNRIRRILMDCVTRAQRSEGHGG